MKNDHMNSDFVFVVLPFLVAIIALVYLILWETDKGDGTRKTSARDFFMVR